VLDPARTTGCVKRAIAWGTTALSSSCACASAPLANTAADRKEMDFHMKASRAPVHAAWAVCPKTVWDPNDSAKATTGPFLTVIR
ncbi:hypothetical protein, partial [uncultured Dubosiella sp.]|uniref:hypothetical protein n=1 Tax=uncultured Dubosiella sp. TaxID=1937011 RepID=UPI0025B4C354